MAERILILGGTREAAELAARHLAEGHDVVTSLAGRTREPRAVEGLVRTGGFGGVEGLVVYLEDAWHRAGDRRDAPVRREHLGQRESRLRSRPRPPAGGDPPALDGRKEGDLWESVANIVSAAAALPAGERVLLALGSQHIAPFATRGDIHFVVRMVDPPTKLLPLPDHQLVLGRPGTDAESEIALLKARSIDRIVCRNSGGPGAYAKLVAARRLGLPVTMIERPTSGG